MLRFSEDLIPMMKVLCPGDNMDQIGPVKERLNLDKDVSHIDNFAAYINKEKINDLYTKHGSLNMKCFLDYSFKAPVFLYGWRGWGTNG